MGLGGVNITRGALGASTISTTDIVSGLLINGPGTSVDGSSLETVVGKPILIKSLSDAKAYGITSSYDVTSSGHVYHHIEEFYRMSGDGTPLYVMLYPDTMNIDEAITSELYGKKLLITAGGNIRQLAIGYNPSETYVPTYVDGLDSKVKAAIIAAQALYDWALTNNMPCQFIVEGRDFNAITATAALDLRNITVNTDVISAHKVSLCIGQDYTYASKWAAPYNKLADIGTMLGTVASISVAQNIGEVASLNLTNSFATRKSDGSVNRTYKTGKTVFTVPALSNGKLLTEFASELEGLDAKGYIFPMTYTGYAGAYWNNDHVCAPIVIDDNDNINECYIRYGRVMDKAFRTLYAKLMPKVKGVYAVDSETGYLPTGVAKEFQNIGEAALGKMVDNAEISAGETTVENSTNLIINGTLSVGFNVQPLACLYAINGTLNLKTSIS